VSYRSGTIEHVFGSDPIETIGEEVEALSGDDLRAWSAGARSERLLGLLRTAERLQAEIVRTVAVWDGQADWAADGALSARAWLAARAPVTGYGASRLVGMARLCRRFPRTAEALASGDVSCAHVEVVAPMVRRREEQYAANEETLLESAGRFSVDDFARVALKWREFADDELAREDAAAVYDHRFFLVSRGVRGAGILAGELDPEATESLLEALDLIAPPDPDGLPEGRRSLAQRRADGLVDLARAYLAAQQQAGRPDVGVQVSVDHDTLNGHSLEDRALDSVRCALARFGIIPAETARRLACDCHIGRVILDAHGEVLDLGRSQRVPNRALRRALEIRDQGCVWPGCDRPARWCDAHHLTWWQHGGATSLDNTCLLCRRHHIHVHELAWTLQRDEHGTYHVAPPPPGTRRRQRRRRAPPARLAA
jgi:Domain of unknown function (DUF222)